MTKAPRTWEDVERMPDDGNRYEWIGERLFGSERLGVIDLDEVFSRHLDLFEDSSRLGPES